MGRAYLSKGEIDRMTIAANIETAYNSRGRYRDKDGNQDWAAWAHQNPDLAEILADAMRSNE
jgi:hypothetical protein